MQSPALTPRCLLKPPPSPSHLLAELSDAAYNTVQSFHSDSAVSFSIFLNALPDMCAHQPPDVLLRAMQARGLGRGRAGRGGRGGVGPSCKAGQGPPFLVEPGLQRHRGARAADGPAPTASPQLRAAFPRADPPKALKTPPRPRRRRRRRRRRLLGHGRHDLPRPARVRRGRDVPPKLCGVGRDDNGGDAVRVAGGRRGGEPLLRRGCGVSGGRGAGGCVAQGFEPPEVVGSAASRGRL